MEKLIKTQITIRTLGDISTAMEMAKKPSFSPEDYDFSFRAFREGNITLKPQSESRRKEIQQKLISMADSLEFGKENSHFHPFEVQPPPSEIHGKEIDACFDRLAKNIKKRVAKAIAIIALLRIYEATIHEIGETARSIHRDKTELSISQKEIAIPKTEITINFHKNINFHIKLDGVSDASELDDRLKELESFLHEKK